MQIMRGSVLPIRIVGIAAWLLRKLSPERRERLEYRLNSLTRLGFSNVAWRRIGPMAISLDVRDFFQRLMAVDIYEPFASDIISMLMKPGNTYVDIGTQLGFTAAQAAKRIRSEGRMVLFEPDPAALKRLKSHLRYSKKKRMPKVKVIPAACSDSEGVMTLWQSEILGQSMLIEGDDKATRNSTIRVKLVKADQSLRNIGKIDFLKIDVEGHELQVLLGLQQTLSSGRIEHIMIEKNYHLSVDPFYFGRALHALIARHGLTGFHESSKQQVTRESLEDGSVMLENLYYTRSPDKFRSVFNLSGSDDGFAPADYDDIVCNLKNPPGGYHESLRVIRNVSAEGVAQGIAEAEQLLTRFPDLWDIRGHLAYWYLSLDDKAKALGHLEKILDHRPDDDRIRAMIQNIRKELK